MVHIWVVGLDAGWEFMGTLGMQLYKARFFNDLMAGI